MPRSALPPTPAPSTDISGKCAANVSQFDASFALPPAAMSSRGSVSLSSAASNTSDSSYRPISPPSPATASTTRVPPSGSRKRPSNAQATVQAGDYELPPPPTRSRKIIQMKPKTEDATTVTKASSTASPSKTTPPATVGGKGKKNNGTTAAGRKIARKTAHSLIERRRRSKMNEEFGVLKDMIPACAGQEMHKLAILQASIEYMRYLEKCVAELKASHRSCRASTGDPPNVIPQNDEMEEDDEDDDMSDAVSPTTIGLPSQRFGKSLPGAIASATTSPAIYPTDHSHYSLTTSPVLQPSDPRHYSLTSSIRSTVVSPAILPSPSIGASPAFSAHSQYSNFAPGASSHFSLTSPALRPQPDERETDREDHEATAALLMLNTDRRSWNGSNRGMSVKDLLSG